MDPTLHLLMATGAEQRGPEGRSGRWFLRVLVFVSLLNLFHIFKHFGWREITVLAWLRSVVFPWLSVGRYGSTAANCLMWLNMLKRLKGRKGQEWRGLRDDVQGRELPVPGVAVFHAPHPQGFLGAAQGGEAHPLFLGFLAEQDARHG